MIAQKAQNTPKERVRVLQQKLSLSAKANLKKKYGILYDKVKSEEVLWEAWKRVSQKGGCAGVDGKSIRWIREEYGEERFVEDIKKALDTERYRPDKIRRCYIGKSGGGKRPLGVPTVTERTVQMAVKLVIEPIFEIDFQDCSYGFRPGRSPHQALREVDKRLWWGSRWVIDIDVSSYFDTIPHDRLLELVRRRVTDPKVLRLIRWWLKAGVLEDGKVTYSDSGTTQGSVVSPLLSNIYLNELDTEWARRSYAKRRVADCHLIRYADDFVVLCPTERKTRAFYRKVEDILNGLELKVNPKKTQVVHAKEGFDFLGFRYRMGYSRRLKKVVPVKFPRAKAMKSIRWRIKEVVKQIPLGKDVNEGITAVNSKLRGWANYFRVGNAYKESEKLAEYACSQLRLFLRRKYQKKGRQWYDRFPNRYFYKRGLHLVPSLLKSV